MQLTIKLNVVKVNKGHFVDPESKAEFDYFQGTLSDGTQIKLSDTVYESLMNKKVPDDLTLSKGSKLVVQSDTGTLL